MRILVTAGNTQTPIDDVRVMTNVFSGRTGTRIAFAAAERGHDVVLVTSHPELVDSQPATSTIKVHAYRTFDDLQTLMQSLISPDRLDAVVHCAAVSDYQLAGSFAPEAGTYFNSACGTWEVQSSESPAVNSLPKLVDVSRGKIKSSHRELWLRMVPTPKLIDQVRKPWGFRGVLVKFKLEVGASDEELTQIAEASRRQSSADLIVANTLAGMHECAYLGPINGQYQRIERATLAHRLLDEVERLTRAL